MTLSLPRVLTLSACQRVRLTLELSDSYICTSNTFQVPAMIVRRHCKEKHRGGDPATAYQCEKTQASIMIKAPVSDDGRNSQAAPFPASEKQRHTSRLSKRAATSKLADMIVEDRFVRLAGEEKSPQNHARSSLHRDAIKVRSWGRSETC